MKAIIFLSLLLTSLFTHAEPTAKRMKAPQFLEGYVVVATLKHEHGPTLITILKPNGRTYEIHLDEYGLPTESLTLSSTYKIEGYDFEFDTLIVSQEDSSSIQNFLIPLADSKYRMGSGLDGESETPVHVSPNGMFEFAGFKGTYDDEEHCITVLGSNGHDFSWNTARHESLLPFKGQTQARRKLVSEDFSGLAINPNTVYTVVGEQPDSRLWMVVGADGRVELSQINLKTREMQWKVLQNAPAPNEMNPADSLKEEPPIVVSERTSP